MGGTAGVDDGVTAVVVVPGVATSDAVAGGGVTGYWEALVVVVTDPPGRLESAGCAGGSHRRNPRVARELTSGSASWQPVRALHGR